jgi:hypothetical protein
MSKEKEHECCYQEMTKGIGGQSMPSECWDEPYQNNYEQTRKSYNANGLDWSGMEKRHGAR